MRLSIYFNCATRFPVSVFLPPAFQNLYHGSVHLYHNQNSEMTSASKMIYVQLWRKFQFFAAVVATELLSII